jgi:excisionase family DNA binding protein
MLRSLTRKPDFFRPDEHFPSLVYSSSSSANSRHWRTTMPRKTKQKETTAQAAAPRDPEFLTVQEVAERLRCSDKTIRRRIAARKLRATPHEGRLLIAIADYWSYVDRLRRPRGTWPALSGGVQG